MGENKELTESKTSRLKKIIIILIVLLLITSGCLAGRMIYLRFFADKQVTAVVLDNQIGEEDENTENQEDTDDKDSEQDGAETGSQTDSQATTPKATTLSLYKGKTSDNERFEVRNMLPGDVEVRYFCVKANHEKDVVLTFCAEITEETKSLGEILQIKVTHLETQKVLYDGAFRDLDSKGYDELLLKNKKGETVAYYEVEVSLPTSAGNQYQAALLKANLEWLVKDGDGLSTGDDAKMMIWVIVLCAALAVVGVVLLWRRKKDEEEKDERENR